MAKTCRTGAELFQQFQALPPEEQAAFFALALEADGLLADRMAQEAWLAQCRTRVQSLREQARLGEESRERWRITHRRPDAQTLAILADIERLRREGLTWKQIGTSYHKTDHWAPRLLKYHGRWPCAEGTL